MQAPGSGRFPRRPAASAQPATTTGATGGTTTTSTTTTSTTSTSPTTFASSGSTAGGPAAAALVAPHVPHVPHVPIAHRVAMAPIRAPQPLGASAAVIHARPATFRARLAREINNMGGHLLVFLPFRDMVRLARCTSELRWLVRRSPNYAERAARHRGLMAPLDVRGRLMALDRLGREQLALDVGWLPRLQALVTRELCPATLLLLDSLEECARRIEARPALLGSHRSWRHWATEYGESGAQVQRAVVAAMQDDLQFFREANERIRARILIQQLHKLAAICRHAASGRRSPPSLGEWKHDWASYVESWLCDGVTGAQRTQRLSPRTRAEVVALSDAIHAEDAVRWQLTGEVRALGHWHELAHPPFNTLRLLAEGGLAPEHQDAVAKLDNLMRAADARCWSAIDPLQLELLFRLLSRRPCELSTCLAEFAQARGGDARLLLMRFDALRSAVIDSAAARFGNHALRRAGLPVPAASRLAASTLGLDRRPPARHSRLSRAIVDSTFRLLAFLPAADAARLRCVARAFAAMLAAPQERRHRRRPRNSSSTSQPPKEP